MANQFFGLLSRLRWINRWGQKYNVAKENVMEHSFEVATMTHALAVIHNDVLRIAPRIDTCQVVMQALYHDAEEALIADAPTPVKYHDPEFTRMYKELENHAERALLRALPESMQDAYRGLLITEEMPDKNKKLVKAADTLAALIKCRFEISKGNDEFTKAEEDVAAKLESMMLDQSIGSSLQYFMDECLGSFSATFDEQLKLY